MVRFVKNIFPLPLILNRKSAYYYPVVFIGLLLIRLFFNTFLPLMDQTEARYAEIARLMVETGDWVVLQIDYGVPFWAKPPLSTWAAAASMLIFGVSEFAVRLPYFMVCLGIALWIGRYRSNSSVPFLIPGCILMTIPEFYLHAGVVSTDVFLLLSIVIVMLSFWESMQESAAPYWGYIFFLGMGLGMLAKGPIVGILTLPPIFLWCWQSNQLSKAFRKAPWILGTLIFIGIALPWYYLTEKRAPGFIDYFVIGEHFNRYFNSEWKGDKYGFPKQQPLGIIWVFFLAFTLPWCIAFFSWLRKKWSTLKSNTWVIFLCLWMLWPLLFFTTSKSLIHPYILPSIVPFALLVSHAWTEIQKSNRYLNFGLTLPILMILIYLTGWVDPIFKNNSDKNLISLTQNSSCFSLDHKSYSSQFYTRGVIQKIEKSNFSDWQIKHPNAYILIRHKDSATVFKNNNRSSLRLIATNKKKGLYANE